MTDEQRANRIAYLREYRANPERKVIDREKDKKRKANMSPADRARKNVRMRVGRYGLTVDQFNILLEVQKGRCAICRVELQSTGRSKGTAAHVDHDHGSGRVRGILCHRCNAGIGLLGDDPDRVRAACEYLLKGRD